MPVLLLLHTVHLRAPEPRKLRDAGHVAPIQDQHSAPILLLQARRRHQGMVRSIARDRGGIYA